MVNLGDMGQDRICDDRLHATIFKRQTSAVCDNRFVYRSGFYCAVQLCAVDITACNMHRLRTKASPQKIKQTVVASQVQDRGLDILLQYMSRFKRPMEGQPYVRQVNCKRAGDQ